MNKKSLILSCVVAGLALLYVILAVVPMIEKSSIFTFSIMYLSFGAPGMIMGLPILLSFVLSIIIFIFAALSVLTACNVITNAKAAKAFRIVEVVLTSIMTFLTVIFAIMMMMIVGGAYILVLFAVLAIPMVVLSSIDLHIVKKAAKSANIVTL